ncbi:hypothetical protein AM10699_40280 [Acaryochloris marina MBIC10699]|nr:hypothetical protein AM10699_40280 [Acaryochloris marina MBIC10699]
MNLTDIPLSTFELIADDILANGNPSHLSVLNLLKKEAVGHFRNPRIVTKGQDQIEYKESDGKQQQNGAEGIRAGTSRFVVNRHEKFLS